MVGNITDAPELRYTQSGAAPAGFTVAVSHRSRAQRMFVVMLWRREEYVGHEHLLPDEGVAVAVLPNGGTVEQR